MPWPVRIDDVRAAAAAIAGGVVETPFLHSRTLSGITGAEVWLKFENHQFTASFKERGALAKLLSLSPAEREAGVIAVSAGNHAQAVAYHAGRLGIRPVIVMPRFTPQTKIERTRAHGAEVLLCGEGFEAAVDEALRIAAERRLTLVHPYDDPLVIAGQGTCALEMLRVQPELDLLLVPVGGGGLVSGMAVAAKALRPGLAVVGVETSSFPAVHCALSGGTPSFAATTIADGIAVKQPGQLTLALIRGLGVELRLVEEGDIEQAIVLLLEVEKTVVEGAGAVGLAALLRHPERFRGQRAGVVLSGGNIDPLVLAEIIRRGMVRARRLVRLRVRVPDRPGSLAQVASCLARANANVEEVYHQRAFSDLPVLSAEVEFLLRTLGPEHVREVLATLTRAGFGAEVVED